MTKHQLNVIANFEQALAVDREVQSAGHPKYIGRLFFASLPPVEQRLCAKYSKAKKAVAHAAGIPEVKP